MTDDQRPTLRFHPDGTFVILQLTDIHWHDGAADDARSRELIERVLEAERPDLVALTGDLVDGGTSQDPGRSLREVVDPMEAREIPWAIVFGNHDDEGSLSRLELLEIVQGLPMCRSERGPATLTGVGNYALRISSAGEDALAAALYFIDSGGYAKDGPGDYAWISREQITWYLDTSRRLALEYEGTIEREATRDPASGVPGRRARPLPALAFFHLPLPEYEDVWDLEPCRGHKYEPVCCPALNSGLFAALVETGDVMGVFVGHDHVNDFEGERHGVRLCYGRASGHASYGRDGFARGARVIRLREGARRFESWVHLEDGTVLRDRALHLPLGRPARDEQA